MTRPLFLFHGLFSRFGLFVFLGAALFAQAQNEAPALQKGWLRGWPLRVSLTATAKAQAYESWITHHGLAQADGRDLRVYDPAGKAVSFFVSFADDTRVRLVFDGSSGFGSYRVFFGNLDLKLPPIPASGLVLAGRKSWRPQGGFSSVTYRAAENHQKVAPRMMSSKAVAEVYATIRKQALANQAKAALPPPAQGAATLPHVIRRIYPHAQAPLPNSPQRNFFHLFRTVINVKKADDYFFVVGRGDGHTNILKMLCVDGNTAEPVVKGWYKRAYGISVFTGTGGVRLSAGRHVLELYTIHSHPQVKVRVGGKPATLENLDGRFAHFDQTAALPHFVSECRALAEGGGMAAIWRRAIGVWQHRGRFTTARNLCRVARQRFAGQPEVLQKFADAAAAARQAGNLKNWPMAGKYPSRIGAAPEAALIPPLRRTIQRQTRSYHDRGGLSSAVWTERGLLYGLPFQLFPDAWCITSGISVADGVLYVGLKDGKMLALDHASRRRKWSFPGAGCCVGTPLLYRGILYYGGLDRRLYALDAERGRMLWNVPVGDWVEGGPAAAGKTVFFGSNDGRVYAIDAKLGVDRWTRKLDGAVTGTPACKDGRVFIGTAGGTFFALAADTGAVLWRYVAGGGVRGGSCVGHGVVAFGDRAGKVHALDVKTGRLIWAAPCKVGAAVVAAPILVGRTIYGGTENGPVYWGIDLAEGKVGWTDKVVGYGQVRRSPLYANGHLVFVGRGGLGGYTMTGVPRQSVLRCAGPIVVDGQLSEQTWLDCPRLPPLYKHNGMQTRDPVVARVLWDAKNFYVGMTGSGNVPGKGISLLIDPRRQGTAVARFDLAANGAKSEAMLTNLDRDSRAPDLAKTLKGLNLAVTGDAWNIEWHGTILASEKDGKAAWTAEIAIPLASLPKRLFEALRPGRMWRVNLLTATEGESWGLAPSGKPGAHGSRHRWPDLQFQNRQPGK